MLAFLVAFFACLTLGMEMGLVIGASVDIAFLLFSNARPKVRVDTISVPKTSFFISPCTNQKSQIELQSACGPEYILAMPTQGLLFPAADFVRTKIQTSLEEYDENERTSKLPVVIDCRNIQKLDYTAAVVKYFWSLLIKVEVSL